MDLIKIIQENSLTVRCLPYVVISHWGYKNGDETRLKENQSIVTLPKWGDKRFVREERIVEKGGWCYVKETKDTNSTIRFQREYDKFFAPTIEEAIQLYLDSKI